MALSRATYPQVVPRAADLMTRGILVTAAWQPIGEAAALASRRRAGCVLAAIGRSWAGATPETLAHAVLLGLAEVPLRAVLWDMPVAAAATAEVTVRRRLRAGSPGLPGLVVVERDRPVGVVLPEPRPGRGLARSAADRLAHLDAEAVRVLRLAGSFGTARSRVVAVVGGVVRDLLLERPTARTDLDLTVEDDAGVVARTLADTLGGQVRQHAPFLTATLSLARGRRVDVATARRERYRRPGALPEVEPATLDEDLGRRDFSVNALAVRLDGARWGEVVDPCGGIEDLRARRIRVLHPLSFIEDPTRIVRAVRLAERLGFGLTRSTYRLASAAAGLGVYEALSGERVRAELELTLGEPAPDRVLTRLGRLGAFRLVLPGYRFVTRACARVGAIGGRDPGPGVSDETRRALVWLALTTHLAPEAWTAWADRLRLPPGVRTAVARARAEAEPLRTALARARTPRDAYRILRGLPEPVAAWAHVESEGAVRRYIARYLGDWRGRRPRLTGDELVALGVAPGPGLGQLLRELVAEEIAGRVRTRAAATRWVRRAVGRTHEWNSETSE